MLSGFNDAQYAAQVIRAGNCLSKINPTIAGITVKSFWNISHFEELIRNVYWTFNEGFRLCLIEKIKDTPLPVLKYCLQKLEDNPAPYKYSPELHDEEIEWAVYQNNRMRQEPKFKQIYDLDKANRVQIIEELNRHLLRRQLLGNDTEEDPTEVPFSEMLKPLPNGDDTLHFINQKLEQAHFRFDILKKVKPRESDGKNPTYFNGCVAAMIGFFFDHGYFHDKYSEREFFYAYQRFTNNKIGKLNSFISIYRNAPGYEEGYKMLKSLKINELK